MRIKAKKLKKAVCLTAIILSLSTIVLGFSGCGQETVSQSEYEALLEKVPKFNDTYLPQFKLKLREFVQKVYSPSSQSDIDEAFSLMEPYMTVNELRELQDITNAYDQNVERNEITNLVVRFGHKDHQSDNMHKFYITFNINEGNYSGLRMAIKFTVNPNGKIFKHSIKADNLTNTEPLD